MRICETCKNCAGKRFTEIDWTWSMFEKKPWMIEPKELPPGMSSVWKVCPECNAEFELKGHVLHRAFEHGYILEELS